MYLTLVPSYGRDYKTAKDVKADWEAGKDFTICDISSPYDGRQINKQDAQSIQGATLNIRFNRLTKIVVIKIK